MTTTTSKQQPQITPTGFAGIPIMANNASSAPSTPISATTSGRSNGNGNGIGVYDPYSNEFRPSPNSFAERRKREQKLAQEELLEGNRQRELEPPMERHASTSLALPALSSPSRSRRRGSLRLKLPSQQRRRRNYNFSNKQLQIRAGLV